MVSQVTITNHGKSDANLRWVEYWGCQQYQFSFRGFMQGFAGKSMHELRRDFATRFEHQFKKLEDGSGLLEKKDFLGRDPADERQFQSMVAFLEKNPNSFLTPHRTKMLRKHADFDDLNPPPTFLVSLDAAADGMTTNGKDFFGSGRRQQSQRAQPHALDGDLSKTGPESALLLERKLTLKPGESRTLTFLYGYLPSGFDLDSLATKYRESARHCARGIKPTVEEEWSAFQHRERTLGGARSHLEPLLPAQRADLRQFLSISTFFRRPAFTNT